MLQLNISSNQLKDRAITSLMKGFETNTSLRQLDISYNLWEDAGAHSVGKMLVMVVFSAAVIRSWNGEPKGVGMHACWL